MTSYNLYITSKEAQNKGEWEVRLYTMTVPDGQYSVEGIDEYLATQTGDYDFTTGSLLAYSSRKLVIDSNEATSKFTFYYSSSAYDILFKVNDSTSKKLAYLLGLDMSLTGTASDKKTINGVQYWSLNLYKSNRSITSTDALQIAEINNGITSIHLKILNNLIYGGRDAVSDNSDTVFSFTFTTAPSFLEITDQDNNPLGKNLIENTSFVLTVQGGE